MSEFHEVTREVATRIVRDLGLRGLPCTTLDETYYFDGPQAPHSEDIFGDKQPKRPWRLCHKWAGYGPERFEVTQETMTRWRAAGGNAA